MKATTYYIIKILTLGLWNIRVDKPKPQLRNCEKIGRNEFCPCGSGKKYKNCCKK